MIADWLLSLVLPALQKIARRATRSYLTFLCADMLQQEVLLLISLSCCLYMP